MCDVCVTECSASCTQVVVGTYGSLSADQVKSSVTVQQVYFNLHIVWASQKFVCITKVRVSKKSPWTSIATLSRQKVRVGQLKSRQDLSPCPRGQVVGAMKLVGWGPTLKWLAHKRKSHANLEKNAPQISKIGQKTSFSCDRNYHYAIAT